MGLRPVFLLLLVCLSAASADAAPRREILAGPMTGEVVEVIDGDTVTVRVHVWIGQSVETLVRIAGIDAPEIHGKCASERARAEDARRELARLLGDGRIRLSNIHLEKYAGRVLADAATSGGADISAHMIEKGLARPYGGERRKMWCGV